MYSDCKYYEIISKTRRLLNINNSSPFISLTNVIKQTVFPENSKIKLTEQDIEIGKKYGFIFKPDEKYPFINTPSSNIDRQKETDIKPNLIIFFGESLSSLKLGCYNSNYKDITPNIDSFANESLIIRKYYNHVSPTVRGIIGQLCSIFPEYGYHIWKNYKLTTPPAYSLPKLLHEEGYKNVYFSASAPEITYLEEQLQNLGYSETFFSNRIGIEFLNGEKGLLSSNDFSDHQIIRSLIKYMKKIKPNNVPFLITASNIETHVDMDITTDGCPYPEDNSPVLNTTHNFDHAFGKFWQYFKESEYYKNTIVILTADHAHFPSMKYTEIAGENFKRLYCDEIAFIIYNPFSKQKGFYDAYTTSIDFAPTVTELLNFQKKNSFLGHSIFNNRKKYKGGIGIFRDKLFILNKGKLEAHTLDDDTPKDIKSLYKLIRYSQQIQNNKRLWYN